jgi:hypothetical protein
VRSRASDRYGTPFWQCVAQLSQLQHLSAHFQAGRGDLDAKEERAAGERIGQALGALTRLTHLSLGSDTLYAVGRSLPALPLLAELSPQLPMSKQHASRLTQLTIHVPGKNCAGCALEAC